MRARCFFAILLFTILFAQLFVSPLAAQTDPDPHRFDEAIETFRRWDAKNAIPDHPILFVGSSSIRMWKTAESFTDLPVVNRGFGGAHISDMLFFKQDILLKYKKPACIVMYCGGNDVAGGKSAERVVRDFKTWWAAVKPIWRLKRCAMSTIFFSTPIRRRRCLRPASHPRTTCLLTTSCT